MEMQLKLLPSMENSIQLIVQAIQLQSVEMAKSAHYQSPILKIYPCIKQQLIPSGTYSGHFVGVKLSDLLSHVEITKFKRLYVLASNDYKITIEHNDPGIENVILASRINGEPLALDNKGPFFIIWPDQADDLIAGKSSGAKWLWGAVEIRKIR